MKIEYFIIRTLMMGMISMMSIPSVVGQDSLYVVEFNVVLNAPSDHYKKSCSNYFKIKAYNLKKALVTTWDQDIEAKSGSYSKIIAETKRIDSVIFEAKRQYEQTFSCKTASGSGTVHHSIRMNDAILDVSFGVPGWGSQPSNYLSILSYPKRISIKTNKPAYDTLVPTYSLPTEDSIRLSASSGFHTATYRWQYSFDGISWVDLPAYNGQQEIKTCGQAIFGKNALERVTAHKNIRFRIKPPHTKTISDVLVLDMVPSAPHITGASVENASCYNGDDGAVTLSFDRDLIAGEKLCILSGGLAETICDGINNKSLRITGLSGGITYKFDLIGYYRKDNYEHTTYTGDTTHEKSVRIDHPTPISFRVESVTDVSCYEGNNGIVRIMASGGTAPYTLLWKKREDENYSSFPLTGNTFERIELRSGTYEFYIRDSKNCFLRDAGGNPAIKQVDVKQPATGLQVEHIESIQPSGYGLNNGAIVVRANGGTGTYLSSWKNDAGQTILTVLSETRSDGVYYTLYDLPAGAYKVTFTDEMGCEQQKTYTLGQPALLTVTIRETSAIQCNGEINGALNAITTGGVSGSGNYTYRWYKKTGDTFVEIPYEYRPTLSSLGAGVYKVIVKDESRIPNTAENTYHLVEPDRVSMSSLLVQPASCFGNNNGYATITARGGNNRYIVSYKKEGAMSYQQVSSSSSSITINNLTKGNYYFNLRDERGCYASFTEGRDMKFTITQPDAPIEIELSGYKHTSGFGRSDGFVSYRIKGGTPNSTSPLSYNVRWKNQSGVAVVPVNAVIDGVFTSRIENIPKGTYTLEVMDKNYSSGTQNACYATAKIAITEPEPLTVTWRESVPVYCHGDVTGELVAQVKGGVPSTETGVNSYKYTWYKVVNGVDSMYTDIPDSTLSALGTGYYKVFVEDGSSPANTVSSAVFHLTEPPLFVVSANSTGNVTCYGNNDGYIHMEVAGGAGNYRLFYQKKDAGGAYTEHPVRADGYSFHVDGLYPGVYRVYVRDTNNCYARDNASLPGGEMEFTVTQPEKPLEAKLYQLKHTSGFGRSDGAVAYCIEGGTPISASPVSYDASWSDERGLPVSHTDTVIDNRFITQIKGFPQGTYTLEVKDGNYAGVPNSCFLIKSTLIDEPAPLTVELINTSTVDCHGAATGELVARVKGGVPHVDPNGMPYIYRWYKVEGGRDSLLAGHTDSLLSTLKAGMYKVFIEDGSDPVNTVASPVFPITEPPLLTTALTTGHISCFGMNDGFIHLNVSGGTGGYRLFLKGNKTGRVVEYPPLADSCTFHVDNLFSDTYSVYVLDNNLCYAAIEGDDIHEVQLSQPEAPLRLSSVVQKNMSGYGLANGSIEIVVEGGTKLNDSTYHVVWRNDRDETLPGNSFLNEEGRYTSSVSDLDKGTYTVSITDKNYAAAYPGMEAGCFLTETFRITEPEALKGAIEETHVISCHSMPDGQLTTHVTGGVTAQAENSNGSLPYKYIWYRKTDNGRYEALANGTDRIAENLPAGNYRVEVSDYSWLPNKITLFYTLTQPDSLTAIATNTTISCGETTDISVSVSGGTPPYRYEWSTGDDTPLIPDVVAGKYVVIVTDSRGCRTITTAHVTAPSDLKIEGAPSNPLCYRGTNGSIELNITGGDPPYSYQWNTGATTKKLSGVPAGIYSVIVTDRGNCSFSETFTLSDPEPIRVDIGEDRTLCAGQYHLISPVVKEPNITYEWTGPDGFFSTDSSVSADKEGIYRLTITNDNGCQATDEIHITVKDLHISSDIVVASQVYAGDTIVIVNISDPMPEAMEWRIVASDSLRIVESSEYQASVIFNYPGLYIIGLRAYVDDCYSDNLKVIAVMSAGDKPSNVLDESAIRSFVVFPSPNSGNFHVNVELTQEAPIRLRIVNVGSGIILSDAMHHSRKEYSIPYRMSISPGTYAVILETAAGQRIVKMITK
jgi:hypothetical protein